MRLPLVAFSKVAAGEVSVNGGMTAVSSAGRVEQQQLWARGGELDGRSRSMTIGIANISASLLCSDNRISSICQTTSSVVPSSAATLSSPVTTSTPARKTKVWA